VSHQRDERRDGPTDRAVRRTERAALCALVSEPRLVGDISSQVTDPIPGQELDRLMVHRGLSALVAIRS
jgi:hypothetical protein